PAARKPQAVAGSAAATAAVKSASETGEGSTPTRPVPRAGSSAAGTNGRSADNPSRRANASDTPGEAASALVCAVYRATSSLISRCTIRPLYVVGATLDTPRSSSGWCATIRSAPSETASSTVSGTQSTTSRTVRATADGEPSTSPTRSHDCAQAGG